VIQIDKLRYFKIRKRFRSSENVFVTNIICDFTIIFKIINKIDEIKIKFWQIINMNVGFGIQYSFGLQQSAVNPIYDFLHASPDEFLLNLGTINRFVDSTYNWSNE
jgi:hypothetical protein